MGHFRVFCRPYLGQDFINTRLYLILEKKVLQENRLMDSIWHTSTDKHIYKYILDIIYYEIIQ